MIKNYCAKYGIRICVRTNAGLLVSRCVPDASAYLDIVAKNNFRAGIFPASALSLFVCAMAMIVFYAVLGIDLTFGLTVKLKEYVFYYLFG